MARSRLNGIRLFRLFGVSVYLDWAWLLVAYFVVRYRAQAYGSPAWAIAEYLALFGIVLLHEFGHALACKSVGGRAESIVLWPLGGVALVDPPQRPGPVLWSIAAGPLVNVALVPVTLALAILWPLPNPHPSHAFVQSLAAINAGLLVLNLLPIYPMDGGQILRALLWFAIGRGASLMVASIIGVVGAVGLGVVAVVVGDWWLLLIVAFVAWQAFRGLRQARFLYRLDSLPRRAEFACPACGERPPAGRHWRCDRCGEPVDAFATPWACPACGATSSATPCLYCGRAHSFGGWFPPGTLPHLAQPAPLAVPPPAPPPVVSEAAPRVLPGSPFH